MFKNIARFFNWEKSIRVTEVFNPLDFSHAATLHVTINKDGTKEYIPFGYSTKKGTPITTITDRSI